MRVTLGEIGRVSGEGEYVEKLRKNRKRKKTKTRSKKQPREKVKKKRKTKSAEVRRMELYYSKNMYENKRIKIKLQRTVRYKITE